MKSKRFLSFLLSILILCCCFPSAYAATTEATDAAEALYTLGLFKGTGTSSDGSPIFDLDKIPTRNQAIIMLVRLLGKEKEALAGKWEIPFTDVSSAAAPYIGYAYANGITAGTSATTYSGSQNATVAQYLTFVLRALGYTSGADFEYNKVLEFSDNIGLTDGRYRANTHKFTRADIAIISRNALTCKLNGTNTTLVRQLFDDDSIWSFAAIQEAGLGTATGLENISSPQNLRIDTQDGKYYLVWDAPSQSVTSYDVYVSTEKSGSYSLFYTPSKNYVQLTSSVIFDLKNGTTYYFKVRAIRWDDIEECHYFSAFTDSISFHTSGASETASSSVTRIYLSDSTINMVQGTKIGIIATYDPQNLVSNIQWSSSNPSVATVVSTGSRTDSMGYTTINADINAVGIGTTIITASAPNGVYATCSVTVLGGNVDKAQAAVNEMKRHLKNPSSLILNSVRIYQTSYSSIVEIDYSAMNGFGGYNRGVFIYTGSNYEFRDNSIIDKYGYPYITIDIGKLST